MTPTPRELELEQALRQLLDATSTAPPSIARTTAKRLLEPRPPIAAELDPQLAEAGAAEGIARSYTATPPEWKAEAHAILERLARTQPELVSDDVWQAGLDRPPNSATALGAVFRWAARAGLIRKTDRVRMTAQARSHGSPMTVWSSRVYVEAGQ